MVAERGYDAQRHLDKRRFADVVQKGFRRAFSFCASSARSVGPGRLVRAGMVGVGELLDAEQVRPLIPANDGQAPAGIRHAGFGRIATG